MAFLTLDLLSLPNTYRLLNVVRYSYPVILAGVFMVSFIVFGVINSPRNDGKVTIQSMKGPGGRPLPVRRKSNNQIKEAVDMRDFSTRSKVIFAGLTFCLLVAYMLNSASVVIQGLTYRDVHWWPGQSAIVFLVGTFFVWALVAVSIVDTKPSPTWVHAISWATAIPLETLILGASLQIYTQPHHEPIVGDQQGGALRNNITPWEVFDVIVYLSRVIILLGLVILYVTLKWRWRKSKVNDSDDEATQPLLNGSSDARTNGHANGHQYGSTEISDSKEPQDAWAKPKETPVIGWYAYLRGFAILIPYLWPRKSWKLQALAFTCFLLMIGQRVVNLLVPIYSGKITDALEATDGAQVYTPWLVITLYILFRWLQGGQGLFGAARSMLWVPVEQYSYRAISAAAFEHVHGLSAEFHTGKRTGELISALNKGSSINTFLELVTFQVGPMVFDLCIAISYLIYRFDLYLGMVVGIVTFLYIYVTVRLAAWRVVLRRKYVTADREMEAVKNDSLHSWDTVKFFNAETYEFGRYRTAIRSMQTYEVWVEMTLQLMNAVQGTLFMMALLCVCFIEAFQVASGFQSVGNFVTLLIYMAQLQAPLNFFGTFYRSIQNNLINAERMLELFKEQPVVVDKPGAEALQDCKGEISFDNITFSYDKRKKALQNFSFHCPPGTTTALVGESGGGKTTVMRLLFRYYNPEEGELRIDGREVGDITIDSVRQVVGIVPQDCSMFNESIMYNLRYANQDATEEEIYNACRIAAIHERILEFKEGYDTKVGERGVKLSGGERQRVAIARTIIKNPKIILLDEATASLDTDTEERIQEALKGLAKDRTMLIIAHRLSTIVHADQILVLHGGTVVEKGTHHELMELDGKYASMWRKQSRVQRAALEAEELRAKARKAMEAADIDSANVSEDESPKKSKKTHKRVNFSQSSLARAAMEAANDRA